LAKLLLPPKVQSKDLLNTPLILAGYFYAISYANKFGKQKWQVSLPSMRV
jgi:hypothetical protein